MIFSSGQGQPAAARAAAAWELALHAAKVKGLLFVNSDFSDLLRLFNDKSVRYPPIGAHFVGHVTEPAFSGRKEELDGSSTNDRFTH